MLKEVSLIVILTFIAGLSQIIFAQNVPTTKVLPDTLGAQFSGLKREGAVSLSDNDFGFYGGGGAGIMIFLKENIFINGEYEIAWASNSWYKDGWINTAGGGIGFKF